MNLFTTSRNGSTTKRNGQVYPELLKSEDIIARVPMPIVSLPWMDQERRKYGYSAPSMIHSYEARTMRQEIMQKPDEGSAKFIENRLYETIVGSLLRSYLVNTKVYYASDRDDLNGSDYIITRGAETISIDLTVLKYTGRQTDAYNGAAVIEKKKRLYREGSRMPHEFFESVKSHEMKREIPLIILQIDYSIVSQFAHTFVEYISSGGNRDEILNLFLEWRPFNPDRINNRVARIVGMDKSPYYEGLPELMTQIGGLFGEVANVSSYEGGV